METSVCCVLKQSRAKVRGFSQSLWPSDAVHVLEPCLSQLSYSVSFLYLRQTQFLSRNEPTGVYSLSLFVWPRCVCMVQVGT